MIIIISIKFNHFINVAEKNILKASDDPLSESELVHIYQLMSYMQRFDSTSSTLGKRMNVCPHLRSRILNVSIHCRLVSRSQSQTCELNQFKGFISKVNIVV